MLYSLQYACHFLGYLGCFVDDLNRQLDDKSDDFDDNSLAKCTEFCQGYKYLGLQVNTIYIYLYEYRTLFVFR